MLNGIVFIFELSLPENTLEHALYLFGLVLARYSDPRWGLSHGLLLRSSSSAERTDSHDVITLIAGLFTDNGVNVLIAATAPLRGYRDAGHSRVSRYAEVYVDCSAQVCRKRDPKGLWKSADKGEITLLPGAGTFHEPSDSPEVRVDTTCLSIEESTHWILRLLDQREFFESSAESQRHVRTYQGKDKLI